MTWRASCAVGKRCMITVRRTASTSRGWICPSRTTCRLVGSKQAFPRLLSPRQPKFIGAKKDIFDSSSIIFGLEIGTSKVCAVVGETNAAAALNVIGVGQARSRGVRKGEITDATTTSEDVRNAIVEADQMADVEIRSVYLGVSGGHIRGFTNRGVHPVVSADREISEEDVQDVVKNAKAINLPADNSVLHAIRQHFLVDGHVGVTDPVGM